MKYQKETKCYYFQKGKKTFEIKCNINKIKGIS
jgi:hypothetical protein